MAAFASCFGMLADQRKASVAIMIKTYCFPFIGAVTGFASVSQLAVMNILQLVAGHALARQILVVLVNVTGLAGDLFMRFSQRKFSLVMVIGFGFPPALFAVAGLALLAQPPLMGVILFVTGNALS